jgi:putative ABC transport system substrate-binding protein
VLDRSTRDGQNALGLDPSGSRTTFRSRIGPSFVNSNLILSRSRDAARGWQARGAGGVIMKRRDFLTGLLLTVTTASTQAQQKGKVHRLAVVDPINPVNDITAAAELPYYRGLFERLQQLGFAVVRNLEIKRFSAEGHSERVSDMISDAANLKPDVIFAFGTRLVILVKGAATTIPVVGLMADPVRFGIATSIARPGGNITGVTHDSGTGAETAKRSELLRQVVPNFSKLGVLISPIFLTPNRIVEAKEIAKRSGYELEFPSGGDFYGNEKECRALFAQFVSHRVDVISVTETNENWAHRRLVIALAKEFKLPAIYPDRIFVELGGLMSLGPNWLDLGRDCARVVSEIFNGANPASIPISQPTQYEITLNLKTAKELGIEVPPSVLVQADEVIE